MGSHQMTSFSHGIQNPVAMPDKLDDISNIGGRRNVSIICKVQFKKIYICLEYKVLTIDNGNFVW